MSRAVVVRRVIVIGSGREPWSVLAVADAARAIVLCLEQPETRGRTYNVLGETISNGLLLRAIGAGAGCTQEIRLPYAVAWLAAALTEFLSRELLTREQVRALSQPLSMRDERFAALGFEPETDWREAPVGRGVGQLESPGLRRGLGSGGCGGKVGEISPSPVLVPHIAVLS